MADLQSDASDDHGADERSGFGRRRLSTVRAAKHRPAWGAFNRRARTANGSVGIWHETFVVERAETLYYAMPPTGLGAATALKPVTKKHARDRMHEGRTAPA